MNCKKETDRKINEGWQPYGSPLVSYDDNGMKIIQAIAAEGDVTTPVVVTLPMTEASYQYHQRTGVLYVVVLAGQSNNIANRRRSSSSGDLRPP